jgi:GH15 family glucan-1,4-alpha-glucosidase
MLGYQHPSGSFTASPDFSQYGYCWLRDSAFVARALDSAGQHEAVARYHLWCIRAIEGVLPRMTAAIGRHRRGKAVDTENAPPARFSLTGEPVPDDWPNFQIDGYGTWLWALGHHFAGTGRSLPAQWASTVHQTAEYLSVFALEPCFDVWEENGDEVHTSTVGCVAAGIASALRLLRSADNGTGLGLLEDAVAAAQQRMKEAGQGGVFAKSNLRPEVDASVLWLSAPLGVVPADDNVMARTVAQIEDNLIFEGGVRRYAGDTFFGGGAWPVLTCSLGLHYARAGRREDARKCLDWSVSRTDSAGQLGEQYGGERRDPEHYRDWVRQWGPPARDLLWSHAMVVLLAADISNRPSG